MKHAIIIYTKVPRDGQSKSRLSERHGGPFSDAQAREFYEASLLDIIDAATAAACADLYICTNAGGDLDYLESLLDRLDDRSAIREVLVDRGEVFDRGMDHAVSCIFKNGDDRLADTVIISGGDMPCLQPAHFRQAAAELERLGTTADGIGPALVESACQEAGSNLLGYTYPTPFDFSGVFYNAEGVTTLDMLARKAEEGRIPFAILDMVADVDLPYDLDGALPQLLALAYSAKFDQSLRLPRRTIAFFEQMGMLELVF